MFTLIVCRSLHEMGKRRNDGKDKKKSKKQKLDESEDVLERKFVKFIESFQLDLDSTELLEEGISFVPQPVAQQELLKMTDQQRRIYDTCVNTTSTRSIIGCAGSGMRTHFSLTN